MRENLTYGSRWQGMETRMRHPRRHPLTLRADLASPRLPSARYQSRAGQAPQLAAVSRLGRDTMNVSALQALITEARNCAMAMLYNAMYIRGELATVFMSDALRARTQKMCDTLVSTKHDVIHELFELDELVASDPSASAIPRYVERIVAWLGEEVAPMHELVMALDSARKKDPAHGTAYVLVAESVANILDGFNRTKAAAATLLAGGDHASRAHDGIQGSA
jgi:hypothetical protein